MSSFLSTQIFSMQDFRDSPVTRATTRHAAILNAVLDRIDITRLLERVDLNALLEQVDLNALIQRIDVEALVTHTDFGVHFIGIFLFLVSWSSMGLMVSAFLTRPRWVNIACFLLLFFAILT